MITLKEWINLPKDMKLIVQASTRDGRDRLTKYPIGMGYLFMENEKEALKVKKKSELLLVAFNETTDSKARSGKLTRKQFAKTLEFNGFQNYELNPQDYFKKIGKYKFTASPQGNGIDCHRHYEALLAGSIPIIEKNPLMEKKYKNLPILWTYDYSEITQDYLIETYKAMLKKEYDFSALYFDLYDKETQDLIAKRGNYWLKRLGAEEYY
jgi:hypothetical protein